MGHCVSDRRRGRCDSEWVRDEDGWKSWKSEHGDGDGHVLFCLALEGAAGKGKEVSSGCGRMGGYSKVNLFREWEYVI